ncbi:MAG: hypothetical protein ACRETL_00755, partial [Gammaproteobacteria bacterium]
MNAGCNADLPNLRDSPIVMQSDRIAASGIGTCLIQSAETVCWGLSGLKTVTPGDGSLKFVALRGGAEHYCGLAADSTAYCWGFNIYGELGDGTRTNRDLPTRVVTTLKFVAISAGLFNTCA